MTEIDQLLVEIKRAGGKITAARQAILEVLCKDKTPITVAHLRELLEKKKIKINKTTVYRELAFLLKLNLVEELDLAEGQKRYELISGSHHHHLICTKCHKISDLEIKEDVERFVELARKKEKFKITEHIMEFFGLCHNCQKV